MHAKNAVTSHCIRIIAESSFSIVFKEYEKTPMKFLVKYMKQQVISTSH